MEEHESGYTKIAMLGPIESMYTGLTAETIETMMLDAINGNAV